MIPQVDPARPFTPLAQRSRKIPEKARVQYNAFLLNLLLSIDYVNYYR